VNGGEDLLSQRPVLDDLSVEGKARPVHDVRAGDTLLFDIRTVQAARLTAPFHSLQFALSRALLNDIADDPEAAPIDEIRCPDGRPVTDPVIARPGNAARPSLAAPDQSNELFASHLLLSLSIYVLRDLRQSKNATPHARWLKRPFLYASGRDHRIWMG
jgi:hypothetical protein